jgi:hypothetical protein
MLKIVRTPSFLQGFFRSLTNEFHWHHASYFEALVVAMAVAHGRHNVSHLYQYLDADTHRTRYNNFFNLKRWDPEKLLQRKARELLDLAGLQKGQTVFLIVDDSFHKKCGKKMEAVGRLHDAVSGQKLSGHQYVFTTLRFADLTIPWGVKLYVKKEQAPKLGVPFRKTTELAAQLIEELDPPEGVHVVVLFDSFYLCQRVVQACRRKGFDWISCLKSNRNLFRNGRKLKAGRYVKNQLRDKRSRRGVSIRDSHFNVVDAGWLDLSHIGPVHLVCSGRHVDGRQLGLVTESKRLNVKAIVQGYAERWFIEQFFKDGKQLLGLGQYQNGSMRAAVIHLHLVCFAQALLTHLRLSRSGEKGKRKPAALTSLSTGSMQNELRRLLFFDTIAVLQKRCVSGDSFVKELRRLMVA